MRHLALALVAGLAACGTSTPTEAPAPVEPAAAPAEVAAAPAEAPHAFAEVSFDELKPLVEQKQVVLLDANGTALFKEGHLPGAIDFEAVSANVSAALPADKGALIVAYCGGEHCSAWEGAAKAAADLGYTQVKHFKGGFSGWKSANGPIEM